MRAYVTKRREERKQTTLPLTAKADPHTVVGGYVESLLIVEAEGAVDGEFGTALHLPGVEALAP
jgi:hypothetical protein